MSRSRVRSTTAVAAPAERSTIGWNTQGEMGDGVGPAQQRAEVVVDEVDR